MEGDKNTSDEREQVAIKLAEVLKDSRKTKIKKLRVFLDEILWHWQCDIGCLNDMYMKVAIASTTNGSFGGESAHIGLRKVLYMYIWLQ